MNHHRRGITLIELVVVLAILGIIAAVTGLTMSTATPASSTNDTVAQITHLRDSAIATGKPVSTVLTNHDTTVAVTAYPDGRVISTGNNVERTTGRVRVSQ